MKLWRCPECNRERFFLKGDENLIMKICDPCQISMEVIENCK